MAPRLAVLTKSAVAGCGRIAQNTSIADKSGEVWMDLGLKGKKVILTGGSRGIGRAALEIFAEEGCDIAFFSRNEEQVAETVASLSRHGGKVIGEAFDLSDLAAYPDWLKSAADRLGGC